MNISPITTNQNYRQQNFGALPKGRPPKYAELVAEVKTVLNSGSSEEANQLMIDYKAANPSELHALSIRNIAYYEGGGSAALEKAIKLFGAEALRL